MNDTITLPRAEAQQILDALYDDDDGIAAAKIIRTQLAQAVIGKAITEVEPNENHDPIAWINWNAATGERSVNFEQESELASQPLYYTPVTGYDLEEMTELKEERERQRDHAVVEIQKLIARNAELESHMQGLSNEINDFQNTIERLTKKVAERSAEHLAAHITHDKGYEEGRLDSENGFEKYLKEGESPLQRLEREIKDGRALMKIYGKALTQIQELLAQQATDQPVYLVATGEVHEGQETYTRHDVPVPLADYEVLYYKVAQQAEQVPATQERKTPYANCRYRICDLPGQCKGEGKCHHPAVQQAEQAGWQPIETAPKDGTAVFAFWTPSTGIVHAGCFGITEFDNLGNWVNPEDTDDIYTAPTHWMPLPAAPKGGVA